MARFDFYEYNPKHTPYVLDIQADDFEDLKTRIIIPMRPVGAKDKENLSKIRPVITYKNKKYALIVPEMGSLLVSSMGKKIGNLKEHHHTIVDSIDFLLQGF